MKQLDPKQKILEPFAGSGQILRLMTEAGYEQNWSLFDRDESLAEVTHQDTISDFPRGFQAVITNPPYLSFHFAKRKGLKPTKSYFGGYHSLYQTAIEAALAGSDYAAMIIPESFITSGLFTDRLQSVISLPFAMFDDTDMPTCLALWGAGNESDFQIWRGDDLLGLASRLIETPISTACRNRIHFNIPEGNLGLRAIDNSASASIWFCEPEQIPIERVKHSARLLTRIRVDGLDEPAKLIALANQKINNWRNLTQDVCLTAFKGLRKDGRFRRRLDCELEGHSH
jgi:hypothetical protein